MTAAFLEHVNFTVADPAKTARNLHNWFGWHTRWHGEAIHGGLSYHVGNDTSYVAIYALGTPKDGQENSYATIGGLNHIGIVVDDLDATEAKIKADSEAHEAEGGIRRVRSSQLHLVDLAGSEREHGAAAPRSLAAAGRGARVE